MIPLAIRILIEERDQLQNMALDPATTAAEFVKLQREAAELDEAIWLLEAPYVEGWDAEGQREWQV